MPEYLPCPHCGETEALSPHALEWTPAGEWIDQKTIRCDNCGALGPPCSTQIQADKAWNERAEIEREEEENDK